MSRIGNKTIALPAGVEVKVDDKNLVTGKGPKGELTQQIDPRIKVAVEGTEVAVLWGQPGHRQKRIRAKVAQFPYYQGEWRNETCDVMAMVPERPYLAE